MVQVCSSFPLFECLIKLPADLTARLFITTVRFSCPKTWEVILKSLACIIITTTEQHVGESAILKLCLNMCHNSIQTRLFTLVGLDKTPVIVPDTPSCVYSAGWVDESANPDLALRARTLWTRWPGSVRVSAHLESARRWCLWSWVSLWLCSCGAFLLVVACRPPPLAPPTSLDTLLCRGYAPLKKAQWYV